MKLPYLAVFLLCRMLDEYFEEQMKEIIKLCSHHRQTMLFSATMTEEVRSILRQEVEWEFVRNYGPFLDFFFLNMVL